MDPDVTLGEMLELCAETDSGWLDNDQSDRLAELVRAMDGWLRTGGFLPTAWMLASAAKGDRVFPIPDPALDDGGVDDEETYLTGL